MSGLILATQGNAEATMSSREIAELTGKRHDNVMRACRDMKDRGVCPQIEETLFYYLPLWGICTAREYSSASLSLDPVPYANRTHAYG